MDSRERSSAMPSGFVPNRGSRRVRSFDVPSSDLGKPEYFIPACPVPAAMGMANGDSDRLAKWIVQEAPEVKRRSSWSPIPKFQCMVMEGGDGFYVQVDGYESEPHEAEVHLTGKLLDGTVLASSRENGIPVTFKLKEDNVTTGFRFAIASMQVGEKAIFLVPQYWTVTKSVCLPNILSNMPTNQTLRFDIELISLTCDIFDDQGIIKKTIKFGTGNKVPVDQDKVFVKYNACLEDGTLVSKSEGVEFSLAEGFFCSAFPHVVKTMTKGEEAIVVIKPEYGFDERGRPPIGKDIAVPPNATLYVNLELLSWKKVTHIGEHQEIVKIELCEVSAERPCNQAVVKVRLMGKLQDGTIFDRRGHNGDDPFKFTIDEEHVIYGVDEAVITMQKGEIATFIIPPQHAFGAVGSNQYPLAIIPPNSTLTYEIELVSYEDEKPWDRNWLKYPNEAAMDQARKKRHEGDELFNLRKYLRAYRRYFRARQILLDSNFINELKKFSKEEECAGVNLHRHEQYFVDAREIMISLALKSAECAMQLQRYKQALDCYNEVLEYDPGNQKALQMASQSFPEPPVPIDSDAMHRGLEKELPLFIGEPSRCMMKYERDSKKDRIFVPPFARSGQGNAGQDVLAAPTKSPVATMEASPGGSASNSNITATGETKMWAEPAGEALGRPAH